MRLTSGELLVEALDAYLDEAKNSIDEDFDGEFIDVKKHLNPTKAQKLILMALAGYFAGDNYEAAKEGGDGPLYTCPECQFDAYVIKDEMNECVLCGFELGNCRLCEGRLTPDNVAWDDSTMCCDCNYRIQKDD